MKWGIKIIAAVALVLLATSGIYDIAAGVQASNWYLRWHEERYGAVAASSVIFTYVLGMFRGTLVTLGGISGLVQTTRGRIRRWFLFLLGVFAYWYVGSLFHHAYRGISVKNWVQAAIALLCLGLVTARKLTRT